MTHWTIEDTKQLYNIAHWSEGYFDINEQGHLSARPTGHGGFAVDLYQLISEINDSDLSLPVLVRFTDILHHRINRLNQAFASAKATHNYQGNFTAVYPIKVNQQFSVVNEIIANQSHLVGLEAGSKSELMAVLGLSNPANSVIVCNGYKDREYIRIALIARHLGHRIYIVIEKNSELDLVINESQNLGIEPLLGVRARLSTVGSSKWQNTGGEKSKFGLSAEQILHITAKLKTHGLLSSLKLLHFHLGSQIASIDDIRQGMSECVRYYSELHRLGAPLTVVDVGGGLSVDYDGTQSRSYFSMNYTQEDYADIIVSSLKHTANRDGLPEPDIITESGRAMTAHHAVLIMNVIEVEQLHERYFNLPEETINTENTDVLKTLYAQLENPVAKPIEIFLKTKERITSIQQQFTNGSVSLEEKAQCEQIYFAICHTVKNRLNPSSRAHRETIDELNEKLADKYFCNFSLFQSLPDVWAINQVFPIVPLHRLAEKPEQRGTLHDITCDSDGRIDSYVDADGVESSLPLHKINHEQPYYLGVFLVGAYQEILGDMHNLFGDTNSINVNLTADGYRLEQARHGDRTDYVLRHIHFDPDKLLAAYKEQLNLADISKQQYIQYLDELESGLTGYTYMEE
jgi:arginine decarboxylase